MSPSNKISEYIDSVCNQIRWKKAHSIISRELENHIIDQKSAFIKQGINEDVALENAIKEMGDPVMVGTELDRTHRPKIEWSIVALTSIVLLLGIVTRILTTSNSPMEWMIKHSIFHAIIGISCMIIAYFIDYTIIGKYPKIIYFGLIAAIIGVTLLPIKYSRVYGEYYYVKYLLLIFPTVFAGIVYHLRNKGYLGIIICGLAAIVPSILLPYLTTMGNIILCLFICLMLLTFSIIKGFFNVNRIRALLLIYIPTITFTIAISLFSIRNKPYLLSRIQNIINPSLDPLGEGYMINLTREIISNAKFIGEGLGASSGATLHSTYTDYLLTYLIHKFGWISFIVIMAVLLIFIARTFILCVKQKSTLGSLVSTAILMTFTLQVIRYVAFNLGFLLISPLTLPLISYGGTSTVIYMTLIGLMLSVFKWGDLIKDNKPKSILNA